MPLPTFQIICQIPVVCDTIMTYIGIHTGTVTTQLVSLYRSGEVIMSYLISEPKSEKHLTHRTINCFEDRLRFRRQMPVNLEGKG